MRRPSRLRMQVDSKAQKRWNEDGNRRLVQLKIEVEALKKRKSEASRTSWETAECRDQKELTAQSDEMTAAWEAERGKPGLRHDVKETV